MVCVRQLDVAEVKVQPTKHDTHALVEGTAVGNVLVVLGRDCALEGRIGTANIGDLFGAQFGFDASLANDKNGPFVGGKIENARDVD